MYVKLEEKYLMFVSKSGFTEPVRQRAKEEGTILIEIDDLYS